MTRGAVQELVVSSVAVTALDATTMAILTKPEVIAVDQELLGILGRIVTGKRTNLQVWAKTLTGTNTVAAVLLDRGTLAASVREL